MRKLLIKLSLGAALPIVAAGCADYSLLDVGAAVAGTNGIDCIDSSRPYANSKHQYPDCAKVMNSGVSSAVSNIGPQGPPGPQGPRGVPGKNGDNGGERGHHEHGDHDGRGDHGVHGKGR
jgi:hypothetical protein